MVLVHFTLPAPPSVPVLDAVSWSGGETEGRGGGLVIYYSKYYNTCINIVSQRANSQDCGRQTTGRAARLVL